MSVDSPPVDVQREADDERQTLLSVDADGVELVAAVEHGADPDDVSQAFDDLVKEIEHRAHLRGGES